MSPIRVSVRSADSVEPIVRALARFIFVASTLFIIFAALFPFDFDFPSHGFWRQVERKFDTSPYITPDDRVKNLLFFVPFGIGLAAMIRPRDKMMRAVAGIVASLLGGLVLSLPLEVLQVFLGFRDPTWSDVIMNTLGAGAGAALVVFGGDRLLESIARGLATLKPYATFTNVTIVLIVYTLAQLALPFLARGRGSLVNWDNGFALLVGNETSADRPWNGEVWQVDLASRAATEAEVRQIFSDGNARDLLNDDLVGSYTTQGPGPYPDQSGHLQDLKWVGTMSDEPLPATDPAHVSSQRWLRTPTAIAPAIHRIRQTSQFTIVAQVAPNEAYQSGPARIVSISGGTGARNISIMHQRHDLSLRLRTPLSGDDGSAPEMIVDDVFDSTDPKQIVLTYDDPLLIVYVDGAPRARMEITPECAVIWRLYPRVGWIVRLTRYGFRGYALVYRLLVFIPFAALLAGAMALSGRSLRTQMLIIAGAIVVTSILLELFLGSMTASGFQRRNLLISVVVASVPVAAIRLRRHSKPSPRRGEGWVRGEV